MILRKQAFEANKCRYLTRLSGTLSELTMFLNGLLRWETGQRARSSIRTVYAQNIVAIRKPSIRVPGGFSTG